MSGGYVTLASPPPLLEVLGGTVVADSYKVQPSSSSSTDNLNSSIIIVILILTSAIIVSASLYLLLRYLRRRSTSPHDDVVSPRESQRDRAFFSRRVSPEDYSLVNSLPLFTFGSITGRNASGGDCAVCLSKFEPHDQLRLLPICCHAFHSHCIDTWLVSNQTCPLCRSTIHATESDALKKLLSSSAGSGNSFRIEIGSLSRRRAASDSGDGRRSYSMGGSLDYIVDDDQSVVNVESTHHRGVSDCTYVEKDKDEPEPPGPSLAAEVSSGRSWLREYIDRLATSTSLSLSSRTVSFRSSGRFFTGSSRRSETAFAGGDGGLDLEANRIGEEISELFRWLSGV